MISFAAASHTYTWHADGKAPVVFPSVTQIIREFGLYGDAERHWDDYSAGKGRIIHRTIELYHAGRLDPVNVKAEVEPYLEAWIKFVADSKFIPTMHEKILHDPLIRVAGTADCIGCYEGRAAVLDIKTGAPHPATAIQLAGYEYLWWSDPGHDGKPARRIAVPLKQDGTYWPTEHPDRHDRDVFLSAVRLHNWRKAKLKGE
jgi:hypothetical protein